MAVKNKVSVYILGDSTRSSSGINRTAHLVLPVKTSDLLDESLDEAVIELKRVKKEVFKPLTPVEIHITNTVSWKNGAGTTEEKVLYFLIAGDAAEENPVGSGRYDHMLALVECTKLAECIVCDTQTVTNVLGRVYTDNAYLVTPTETEG